MSTFEDLIQGKSEQTAAEKKKAAYAKSQAEKRQACFDMTDKASHDAVSTAENMRQFLTVMSRFEAYSLHNNLLIFAQKPTATKIRDYNGWKKEKQEGEPVTKQGSRSMMILEPNKYTGSDGGEHVGYNVKQMFDVADVVGIDPEPRVFRDMRQLVRALVNECPVEITTMSEGYPAGMSMGAYYDPEHKKIFARTGMNPEEIFTSVAAAIAHSEIENMIKLDQQKQNLTLMPYRTEDHEFQARCAAFVLCMKYNASAGRVNISSVPPKYSGVGAEDIRKDLFAIHFAVRAMEKRMERILNPPEQGKENQKNGSKRGGTIIWKR